MTEAQQIELINQLFEIEKKALQFSYEKLERNIERMKHIFSESGYSYKIPTGEKYDETRLDCAATILSNSNDLTIFDTVKPIIFKTIGTETQIIQPARVIVK